MRIFFISLILFFLYSCKSSQKNAAPIYFKGKTLSEDTFFIKMEALNMSEDLSILSTKSDEILLFLYAYDSLELQEPLYSSYLVFDTIHTGYTLNGPYFKKFPEKILFFLLEMDSETSVQKIDSVLRAHPTEIIKLFYQHDVVKLEKYLGDDDILGIRILENFNSSNPLKFEITGFLRADKYHYRISTGTK